MLATSLVAEEDDEDESSSERASWISEKSLARGSLAEESNSSKVFEP